MSLQLNRTVLWSCVLLAPITIPVGESSIGLHVPIIIAAAAISIARYGIAPIKNSIALFFLIVLMSINFIFANALSPCSDILVKSIFSFSLFLIIFSSLIQLAARSDTFDIEKDLRFLVIFICTSVVMEQIWLRLTGASELIRPSGIYLEPSHLALSVSPLLVALVFGSQVSDRWLGWAAILVLFTLSGSATLFVIVAACLLTSSLAISKRRVSVKAMGQIFLSLVAISSIIYISPYRDEFTARIVGISEINADANISSLVYVNGWETAFQNLSNSHGMGLGFNRMGCNPRPETDVGEFLEKLNLGDLNYNDGSFTVAKILSELGVFGAFVWVLAGYLLLRIMRMAKDSTNESRITSVLSVSAGVVLVFGGLVRGTGYFSGPFLLGLFCLLLGVVRYPVKSEGA